MRLYVTKLNSEKVQFPHQTVEDLDRMVACEVVRVGNVVIPLSSCLEVELVPVAGDTD